MKLSSHGAELTFFQTSNFGVGPKGVKNQNNFIGAPLIGPLLCQISQRDICLTANVQTT
jgi:hypothetical protein